MRRKAGNNARECRDGRQAGMTVWTTRLRNRHGGCELARSSATRWVPDAEPARGIFWPSKRSAVALNWRRRTSMTSSYAAEPLERGSPAENQVLGTINSSSAYRAKSCELSLANFVIPDAVMSATSLAS